MHLESVIFHNTVLTKIGLCASYNALNLKWLNVLRFCCCHCPYFAPQKNYSNHWGWWLALHTSLQTCNAAIGSSDLLVDTRLWRGKTHLYYLEKKKMIHSPPPLDRKSWSRHCHSTHPFLDSHTISDPTWPRNFYSVVAPLWTSQENKWEGPRKPQHKMPKNNIVTILILYHRLHA